MPPPFFFGGGGVRKTSGGSLLASSAILLNFTTKRNHGMRMCFGADSQGSLFYRDEFLGR